MPISITDMTGIVPLKNPELLPDNAAQEAHNCAVTSGAIAPLRVQGDFVSMHDADLKLLAGIPASDVPIITKPTSPSVRALTKLAHPENWLRIIARDWISYVDVDGTHQVTSGRSVLCPIRAVLYSEAELFVVCHLPIKFYFFPYGGPYFLRGPRYQFVFNAAANGPEGLFAFPFTASVGDPEFYDMRVPLVDENQNIYSYFQVADISGPRYDEDILVENNSFIMWIVPGAYPIFRINMNYANPRRQHRYYVTSAIDGAEREGPPSEISERIVMKPGERLTLDTPRPNGYKTIRLYRAGTRNEADFARVDEYTADTYTDWKESTTEPLPPFGNRPAIESALFRRGSGIHPAHFGFALHAGELILTDQFRLHAWPKTHRYPFPNAIATALTGDTILVFQAQNDEGTGGKVWACYGQNPAAMGSQQLSENTPLLNVAGLFRLHEMIGWPTYDGLAVTTGGKVEIVTTDYYTRKEWRALKPEKMIARTADNSVFLEHPDSTDAVTGRPYLRFDLDEKGGLRAVTTYDTVVNGTYRWRSKEFYFAQPTIMDYVRVVADGPVQLEVYCDRKLAQTLAIDTDEAVPLSSFVRTTSTRFPRLIGGVGGGGTQTPAIVKHARQWSFRVIGEATVRRIEAYDRVVHEVETEIQLSADNVPNLRSTWFRFKDLDRFCVLQVSAQTVTPIAARLYADGQLVYENDALTHGRAIPLPRTLPRANLWTLDVESPVRVDGAYLSRRRAVDAGDGIRKINDGPYAPWLAERYQFTNERRVSSVIVHARKAVTMNLYYDGAVSPSEAVAIANGDEVKVTLGQYSSLEFDFAVNDSHVQEVIVFTARVESVGPNGIAASNPPSTRGLLFKFSDQAQLACGSIGATNYATLRATLKADGVAVWVNQRVLNGRAFALPHDLPYASLWELDITGGGEIHSFIFLPRTPELVQGRTIFTAHPRGIPPWLHKRQTFQLGATRLISAWVELDSAFDFKSNGQVTMRVWLDGAAARPTRIVRMRHRVETLLEIPADCTTVDFDFTGEDAGVVEMGLFGRDYRQGDLNGVSAGPQQNFRKLVWRFPNRADIAACIVAARDYRNVRVRVLADGQQVINQSVADGDLIKLPRRRDEAGEWEADITAPQVGVVDRIDLIPRRGVPAAGALQRTRSGPVAPWLYERYEYADRQQIRSVFVDAATYPVNLHFYFDKSIGISETYKITGPQEVLIESRVFGSVEFAFDDDAAVRDVTVLLVDEQLIGADGITLQNPASTRGLRYKFADAGSFAAGSVGATAYPVTLTINGTATTIANGGMFFFPRDMARATQWSIDLDPGNGKVTSLVLLPWTRIDAGETIRETRPEIGITPWLTRIYQYTDQAWPGAAIVHADAYPITMRLFADGATAPSQVLVESADEVRLGALPTVNELRIDFAGDDTAVREMILFTKRMESITGGTPVLLSGPSFRKNLFRFAEPNAFACGMVTISQEPIKVSATQTKWTDDVLLRLYAGGILVHTERIRAAGVFTLPPALAPAIEWEIDVETSANITGLTFVPWMREAFEGGAIRAVIGQGEIPRWLYTEYEMVKPWKAKSAITHADRVVPLDLYIDGATAPRRFMVQSLRETVFEGAAVEGRRYRMRVGEQANQRAVLRDPGKVAIPYLSIFREEIIPVDGGAIVVRPADDIGAWRNKLLVFKETGSWGVCRVLATQYPVRVRLLIGMDVMDEMDVTDSRAFKFDRQLPSAKVWGLDIESAGGVQELQLFSREVYPVENGLLRIQRAGDPFTWLGRRVLTAKPIDFSACRVEASAYPITLRLYANGAVKPTAEVLARNRDAFRLPRLRPERDWEIDAICGEGTEIREVAIGTGLDKVKA